MSPHFTIYDLLDLLNIYANFYALLSVTSMCMDSIYQNSVASLNSAIKVLMCLEKSGLHKW